MRKKRIVSILITMCFLLGLFCPVTAEAAEATPESVLSGMSTEQKLCQMLMVETRYFKEGEQEKQAVTKLPEAMKQFLAKHDFGGVILYGENFVDTEQAMKLIDEIKTANTGAAQMFIAVDQEGGIVTRLAECVQGPGNMALTATGNPEDVETMGRIIATEVSALGINIDFCPDEDVNNNPANPIIGIRSFSDDPWIVADYAALMSDDMREAGIISSPKHFPGHGDTQTDSHTGFPMINKSYDELKKLELIPFMKAIESGAEMIMTAHIQYPRIEKNTYNSKTTGEKVHLPATLSKKILTDILRGDLGYDGVIITDAMDMAAIAKNFEPMDAMIYAIEAGVDIILTPGSTMTAEYMAMYDKMIGALAAKAESDPKLMEKINAAVLRILKLKQKHGLLKPYDSSDLNSRIKSAMKTVSTKANHEIEWDITKRAVTMVKNENNTLPIRGEGKKTVILTAFDDEPLPMNYAVDLVRQEGKLPDNSTYEVYCYNKKTKEEVLGWIGDADYVVAISEMGSASYLTGDTAKLLDEVLKKTHEHGGRFIILSVNLPYDVARFTDADAAVICYGERAMRQDPREDKEPMKRYGPNMAAGLYMMLQDTQDITGSLPVNLPKLNEAGDGYTSEYLYKRGFGLSYADKAPAASYSNEWVKGRWYSKNGSQTYKYQGKWHKNGKGWWYGDASGWYARNCWQKIDSKWYYFKASGYAAAREFVKGWWLNAGSCSWTYKYQARWHKDGKGWWYGDASGWYAKNADYVIDGKQYTFDSKGYCTNP